jgi:hypothetical protein
MGHSIFLSLFIGWQAIACDLNLNWPKSSSLKSPIQAHVDIQNDELVVQFEVHTPTINAKPKLASNEHPYMFDAVEVFVTTSDTHFPYYEFEISPYNEKFEVEIDSLKIPFINGVDRQITTSTTIVHGGWVGEIHYPLDKDTPPEKVVGNLYGIVGKRPKRTYWSAFLPNQPKPNFHQPDFFQPLANCGEPKP